MSPLFSFLLSGENPELGLAELKALTRILGVRSEPIRISDRLALLDCTVEEAVEICRRSAFIKEVSLYLSTTNYPFSFKDVEFPPELLENERIAVRARKIGAVEVSSLEIERKLGAFVKESLDRIVIDLENPKKVIRTYVAKDLVLIGILLHESSAKEFEPRRPGNRPFQHPSALQPKLARCMVNLTETPIGGTILDPFSGTGSIPLEALALGYEAIGVEVKIWIARGCNENLKVLFHGRGHTIAGDARSLPLRCEVDGIATDPPYGRSTFVSGRDLRSLMERFISEAADHLRSGGRMVISYPSTGPIREVIEDSGLRLLGSFSYRVHASLIRRISITTLR